jgi:hypothetical protein
MGLEQDNIPDKYKINDIIICLYEVNNLQELTDNSICYINGSLAFFHDGTRIPIRDESNILQKIKDGMI